MIEKKERYHHNSGTQERFSVTVINKKQFNMFKGLNHLLNRPCNYKILLKGAKIVLFNTK